MRGKGQKGAACVDGANAPGGQCATGAAVNGAAGAGEGAETMEMPAQRPLGEKYTEWLEAGRRQVPHMVPDGSPDQDVERK